MYYNFSKAELREISRSNIETLEIWARRLIDEKMSEEYGQDFLDFKDGENYLIKKEVRQRVHSLITKDPDKFPRMVDALFLDDICYILCHPKLYRPLFKEALDYIYPQGSDEAREFLQRLVPIRNPLSHANPVSVHQAEQAVCYANDFVDGLKEYYKDKGMERKWSVPSIIRVQDSLGNVFENLHETVGGAWIHNIKHEFYCGEEYAVDIEVDASFSPDEYDIKWSIDPMKHLQDGGCHYRVKFDEKDVGESCLVCCKIISKKKWHRYRTCDFSMILSMVVLPPV